MKLNTDRNRLHEAVVFAVTDAAETLIAARMAPNTARSEEAERVASRVHAAVRELAVAVLKAAKVPDAEMALTVAVDALYERRKAKRILASSPAVAARIETMRQNPTAENITNVMLGGPLTPTKPA